MGIYKIKYNIPEVWVASRVIVQKYGHMKKFTKHLVTFAIRQIENFTYLNLVEF